MNTRASAIPSLFIGVWEKVLRAQGSQAKTRQYFSGDVWWPEVSGWPSSLLHHWLSQAALSAILS